MRMAEGHILAFKKLLFQKGTVCTEFRLPEVSNIGFQQSCKAFFAWWILQKIERMGKVVSESAGSYISKVQFKKISRGLLYLVSKDV